DEAKMMSPDEVAAETLNAVLGRKRSIILSFQGKLTALLSKFIPGIMDTLVFNTIAKEKDSPVQGLKP
ncbi:MAG: short-chain dehydrogenase, partial [Bacteroidota bacterium]